MSKQSYIGVVAVLVVLIGLFALISHLQSASVPFSDNPTTLPPPGANYNIDIGLINNNWNRLLAAADSAPAGNPNAPYTLIEIGDFQCPQCGKAHPLVEQMLDDSKGSAKFYFVNNPLPMHAHSHFAALAGIAAGKQGKFWQMYDLLYSHQDELIPSEIQYYSEQTIPGFKVALYNQDVGAIATSEFLKDQVALVRSLHLDCTPTFLLRSTNGGTVGWYVGLDDTPTSLGFQHLAKSPPWINGGKIIAVQNH
jgi:protein-disulfide isomerase